MTFQPDIFKGKVLFITGGRSGIGYHITQIMMRHGCDTAIIGRDAKGLEESATKLEKGTGQRCLPLAADVREPAQLEEAVAKTVDRYGKIDFVVCGAAGNFLAPISGLSPNAFKTVISIDVLGTYNTIKATLPHIRASQGSYLHISATLHYHGLPYQAHVSAAKAGVDALSQALAVEEGPRGVRSNVVAPGPIENTEGMLRLTPKGIDPAKQVPLQRMGTRDDIANAAVFLFSPAAQWMTGAIVVVDGGEQHNSALLLPYPDSVLYPEKVAKLIHGSKAKL